MKLDRSASPPWIGRIGFRLHAAIGRTFSETGVSLWIREPSFTMDLYFTLMLEIQWRGRSIWIGWYQTGYEWACWKKRLPHFVMGNWWREQEANRRRFQKRLRAHTNDGNDTNDGISRG